MNFEDFLKNKKEKREKYKKEFLEAKKDAIKHIENCQDALILITENGAICVGTGIDINSALTEFFANVMEEGTFTKEELMRCIKLAELVLSGDLEKINEHLEKLTDALEN